LTLDYKKLPKSCRSATGPSRAIYSANFLISAKSNLSGDTYILKPSIMELRTDLLFKSIDRSIMKISLSFESSASCSEQLKYFNKGSSCLFDEQR